MDYLNNNLGLVKHLFPDMYHARSIDDFLQDKDKMPHPSRLRQLSPMSLFTNMNSAQILFHNVDLTFDRPINDAQPQRDSIISDLSGKFPIRSHRNISEGRYGIVIVDYNISSGLALLKAAVRYGGHVPDFSDLANVSVRA